MFKNKRGFSLIELTAVIMTILIIIAIAIPQYRTSALKSRIVSNLGLMQALQNDIIDFYNVHQQFPISLFELSLTRNDFGPISQNSTVAVRRSDNCLFQLLTPSNRVKVIRLSCGDDWALNYRVEVDPRTARVEALGLFQAINGSALPVKIANELGWPRHDGEENFFEVLSR